MGKKRIFSNIQNEVSNCISQITWVVVSSRETFIEKAKENHMENVVCFIQIIKTSEEKHSLSL